MLANSNASVPAALIPNAVTAATPSKADEIRAEAEKAVAAWRAGRGVAPVNKNSARTPSPQYSPNPNLKLDALFDGSLPTSKEVLDRAAALGLSEAALGLVIAESATVPETASKLSSLGVLGAKEAALSAPREDEFRFLLTRLWRKAAPAIPGAFPVDKTWSVPALKVERDGTTYFVHAVVHGQTAPPRRGEVLALARDVRAAGRALYSEQNLPAYYGYVAGRETLDHAAPSLPATPVTVVAAAPGFTQATLLVKRVIDWVVSPGTAVGAAVWAAVQPGQPWPWIALAAALVFAGLTLTGGLPLLRFKRRRRAAAARRDGLEDIAAQYGDEARNFFNAKPDLEVLRGLELPQPLGAQADDAFSIRSRAIADAVAADAAAAGAKEVHLVVGHLHAHEVAWRLANGPRQTVPGSQKS